MTPERDVRAEAAEALADARRYLTQRVQLGELLLTADPAPHEPPAAALAAPHEAPVHVPAEPGSRPSADDPAIRAALATLEAEVRTCTRCPLHKTRTQGVFGVGSGRTGIMFIGEGPGADEDAQGIPFVGRAGKLLTDAIVKGMRLTRDDVYIANIVKSRPPENRVPLPEEAQACMPYLVKQIALLQPTVICALGLTAARWLLGTKGSLASHRGVEHVYHGIRVIVTYHPAAILRSPEYKRPFWEDLQAVMHLAGIPIPPAAARG